MNKFFCKAAAIVIAVVAFSACQSAGEQASSQTSQNDSTVTSKPLSIRYIDRDSLTANYDLVKDYNEKNIHTLSSLDNAQRTKQNELQKRANEIQNKVNNRGYISESTYQTDVQRFQQQQAEAERYMANLQAQAQQDALDQSKALQDSLNNFIEIYMKSHNYDAILFKDAGVYFNPELDITAEVVAGLNARYNKSKKAE